MSLSVAVIQAGLQLPRSALAATLMTQLGGDPLTAGIYFLVAAYFVCYYGLVILRYHVATAVP